MSRLTSDYAYVYYMFPDDVRESSATVIQCN